MNTLSINSKVSGRYYIQVKRSDGTVKESLEFDNLITNGGMDMIGYTDMYSSPSRTNNFATNCGVGTGTTPPDVSDVNLEAQVAVFPARGSIVANMNSSYVSGPPAYFTGSKTFTFPIGGAVGNFTEIGMGGFPTNTSTLITLFSRSLILDGGGMPTVLSVGSDEQLIVTYELRAYIDTTDNVYSFDMSMVTYSGVYRRSAVNSSWAMDVSAQSGAYTPQVYNGTIGDITGSPSGSTTGLSAMSKDSYVPGNYYIQCTSTSSISQGNLSGGISAIKTVIAQGAYQFSVSPPIPKTSSDTMSLVFRFGWDRYTP